jgi:hypothetical protein
LPIAFADLVKPSSMAIVTVGIPAFSAAILARELAAVQLPHPALPEITRSHSNAASFAGNALTTSDSRTP